MLKIKKNVRVKIEDLDNKKTDEFYAENLIITYKGEPFEEDGGYDSISHFDDNYNQEQKGRELLNRMECFLDFVYVHLAEDFESNKDYKEFLIDIAVKVMKETMFKFRSLSDKGE